jgi:hypothetical protein
MMHQHNDPAAIGQPGQERQTVLAVDHHVGSGVPQRPQADARSHHRQSGPDVDRVPAAAAADPDAVDPLAAGGAIVTGGAQRDVDTVIGQLGPDPLKIGLAPPALRVAGVAPAQQQH